MTASAGNRVLHRRGARELTQEEVAKVSGAVLLTLLSVIVTNAPGGGYDDHLDS